MGRQTACRTTVKDENSSRHLGVIVALVTTCLFRRKRNRRDLSGSFPGGLTVGSLLGLSHLYRKTGVATGGRLVGHDASAVHRTGHFFASNKDRWHTPDTYLFFGRFFYAPLINGETFFDEFPRGPARENRNSRRHSSWRTVQRMS